VSARRYLRQTRFAPLGEAGQAKLAEARVLLVGCGALGGHLAQSLVRCGAGTLRIVDRDVVEETNLPRQVLFDEQHALEARPKALAAAETLARIGGTTRVEPRVAHLDAALLDELGDGVSLVLDGTDNLETPCGAWYPNRRPRRPCRPARRRASSAPPPWSWAPSRRRRR